MWCVVILDHSGNVLSAWTFSSQANATTAATNFKTSVKSNVKVSVLVVSAATDSVISTGYPGVSR